MKLKKPFKKSGIEVYEESEAILLKQNKDNLLIVNWIYVLMLFALIYTAFVKNWEIKIFWGVVSVFMLVFISSLNNSIKQNRIIILLLKRRQ